MKDIDRLRAKLDEAGIPYESYKEPLKPWEIKILSSFYVDGMEEEYSRNQIIYGRIDENTWKLDAIDQFGSYGHREGLIEVWGQLGMDSNGDPLVMTADEVFEIIYNDWVGEKKNV